MKCDHCHRQLGADYRYSSWSKRHYCPTKREASCDKERRRLLRSGAILLDVENADVVAAMKRHGPAVAVKVREPS